MLKKGGGPSQAATSRRGGVQVSQGLVYELGKNEVGGGQVERTGVRRTEGIFYWLIYVYTFTCNYELTSKLA